MSKISKMNVYEQAELEEMNKWRQSIWGWIIIASLTILFGIAIYGHYWSCLR